MFVDFFFLMCVDFLDLAGAAQKPIVVTALILKPDCFTIVDFLFTNSVTLSTSYQFHSPWAPLCKIGGRKYLTHKVTVLMKYYWTSYLGPCR